MRVKSSPVLTVLTTPWFRLSEFGQGDVITALLDLNERSLSFGKNGAEPVLAFSNMPVDKEIFPCVVFCSQSGEEKVRTLHTSPIKN